MSKLTDTIIEMYKMYGQEPEASTVLLFSQGLGDFSEVVAIKAIMQAMMNEKFRPVLATVREYALGIPNAATFPTDLSKDELDRIMTIREDGGYSEAEILEKILKRRAD